MLLFCEYQKPEKLPEQLQMRLEVTKVKMAEGN